MVIEGPGPLENWQAAGAARGTSRELALKIRADLMSAQHDGHLERPVLGWVCCLVTLLEHMGVNADCGEEDALEWKEQYFTWFDTNYQRLPKRHRKKMREYAERLWDRLIEHSASGANLAHTGWDRHIEVDWYESTTSSSEDAAPSLSFDYRLSKLAEVGCFGLVIEINTESSREWFLERGFDGTGYSVHGLVDSIVRLNLPKDFAKLSFSAEADNLLLTCKARKPLERVRDCVERVISDEPTLSDAIEQADPSIME